MAKTKQNKNKQTNKKTQLEYLVFSVHAMPKLSMQDFEYNLTSMEDECNCPVVCIFFNTALLENWDENLSFPVPWLLLGFPNLLTY